MNDKKPLVLDANILIRAVLGVRVSALLEEMAISVHFYTPSVCVRDAYTYLPAILQRRGMDTEAALSALNLLLRGIHVIDEDLYGEYEVAARKRMRKRDEDDWPIMACALLLHCPIWTEDADFFGSGVAVWTTDRVMLHLEE